MAKTIQLGAYENEAVLVSGMYEKNKKAEYELYAYCADYYYENYRAIFNVPDYVTDEIFQNSLIKFWENIEARKIYVKNNMVIGTDDMPLKGSIRTYFMGIARIKYLEWRADNPYFVNPDTDLEDKFRKKGFDMKEYVESLYADSDVGNVQYEIIADNLPKMSRRCYEILTKYYYEGKDLDRILQEIPSIESKNALKTKKNKCLNGLRDVSNVMFNKYLNYCR